MLCSSSEWATPPGSAKRLDELLGKHPGQGEGSDPEFRCNAEVWFMLHHVFTPREAEKLMCGECMVDANAWRNSTKYEGFDVGSKPVLWFWEVVESLDAGERAQLLAWARGSSVLPHTGFKDLTFLLRRDPQGSGRLPTAHTCEFSIDLPDYSTKHELEQHLRRALVEVMFD